MAAFMLNASLQRLSDSGNKAGAQKFNINPLPVKN
jgi:hypothetical protein